MSSCTSVLFILCGILSSALCCDWLKHFGHRNGKAMNHLQLMGGPFTKEKIPVPFPVGVYEQIREAEVETQLAFIRDSLTHISELYQHENITSVAWNSTELEHFRLIIDRQTDEISSCVSRKRPDRKLRNHFMRLKRCSLERGGGSAACWEIIRKATMLHLEQLDLLVNPIKDADAASRGRSTPN